MAMTLEQKVAKKAKGMDKLKYKKGLAIVTLSLDESAVEYDSELQYRVRLYFKSKAAINRVGKLLGSLQFNKKQMLSNFERGYKSIELNVSSYEKYMMDGGENIVREIKYDYLNSYSDSRFFLTIDPRKPLSDEQKKYFTGSTADGEPLSSYFVHLQKSIIEGNTQYII